MAKELYSGSKIKLFWSVGEGYPYCFVTFSAWSSSGEGSPFGLSFFEKHKIPAFYIVHLGGNHWWHTPEMFDVCEIVRRYTEKYFDGCVLYGSSMGGYGAIHFQDFFRAKKSISIDPQLVVSQEYAQFEPRWKADRALIADFLFDETKNLKFQIDETVILFDKLHGQDRKHVEIAEKLGVNNCVIDVPYSNHGSARTLIFSGVLKKYLVGLADECELNSEELAGEAAVSFEKESKTFFNFFRKTILSMGGERRIHYSKLFERFVEDGGAFDFESAYMVAEIYAHLGDSDSALEYSERSLSLYPKSGSVPNYLLLKHQSIKDRLGIV